MSNSITPVIFCVNQEPYCLWETDLAERNIEFLDGLDPEYFNYLREILSCDEDKDKSKINSVAQRILYHHSLETFFTLLGALTQAPNCAYAWISKCGNTELRKFVEDVSINPAKVFNKFQLKKVDWDALSEIVFDRFKSGSNEQKSIRNCFSTLWSRLASDFLSQYAIDEYNSMKHGFRITPGGFRLMIGETAEKMSALCHSEYGASFLRIEKLSKCNKQNISSFRVSNNWSIEKTILLTQLIYMSINNVITGLKNVNKHNVTKNAFVTPTELDSFEKPWRIAGSSSIAMDRTIRSEDIQNFTREDLLKFISDQENEKE